MPAKGTSIIPDQKKVELVIAKELRPSGTETNSKLANQFGVSENSVAKLNYEVLSETQKELYHRVKTELAEKALFGASLALEKGQELVKRAESAKDLGGVTQFGKFAHEVYRLESGQSTVNVLDQAAMIQSLVNYCKLHANGPRQLAAMVMFAEGSGVDESLRRKEAERILAESELATE